MDEILKLLLERKTFGGIATKRSFLNGFATCLGDNACRAKFLEIGTPDEWKDFVEKSASSLVYHHPDMEVDATGLLLPDGVRSASKAGAPKFDTVTSGACLDFHCTLTTSRQDREGDILESEGAEVDQKMPLLLQHIPMLNIGKLIRVTDQNKKRVTAHFAVVNTELGRDTAVLIEFGALRISHGFIPTEYEKLKEDEKSKDRPYLGFRVRKFKVLEGSAVSIPANEDAIIDAWSKNKLTHALTKSWGQELWRAKPPVVNVPFVIPPEVPGARNTPACGCKGNPAPTPAPVAPEPPQTLPDRKTTKAAVKSSGRAEKASKAGKISQRNLGLLQEAEELVEVCMADAGLSVPTKALMEKAYSNLDMVIEDCCGDMSDDMGDQAASTSARNLLAAMVRGGTLPMDLTVSLLAALDQEKKAGEERSLAKLLAI